MSLGSYAMHVYTYVDGVDDVGTLTDLVRVCGDLGMSEIAEEPIVRAGGPHARRLFEDSRDNGIRQAFEYTAARLSAFLVCLAPEDRQQTWHALDAEWTSASTGPPGECVGRVRMYYALYDGDTTVEVLEAAARDALPGSGELGEPAILFAGCYLWEVDTGDDHRRYRTLVILAPKDQEERSDGWLWPDANNALRPLPHYLWEMAKVRYEARRFVERRSLAWTYELVDRAARFEIGEGARVESTEVRYHELRALQRYTALAAAGEAVLWTMRRTVQSAADNAQAVLRDAGSSAEAGGGLFDDDRSYVAWLTTEITDEADWARDAVRYAKPMADLASAETEARLRDISERGQVLSVLQTAIIAAVGLLLAATQAIGYRWRTYASIQTPFIVWVLFLGLFLPLATASRPSGRHARRWRVWVAVSGAGFAASSACLAVDWLARWRTGSPAAPRTSIATAVVAVLLAAGLVTVWPTVRRCRVRPSQADHSAERNDDARYDADQDGRRTPRAVHRPAGAHHPMRQRSDLDDRARRRAVSASGSDAVAAGGPGAASVTDGMADL